jgi:hypothetical protein
LNEGNENVTLPASVLSHLVDNGTVNLEAVVEIEAARRSRD